MENKRWRGQAGKGAPAHSLFRDHKLAHILDVVAQAFHPNIQGAEAEAGRPEFSASMVYNSRTARATRRNLS